MPSDDLLIQLDLGVPAWLTTLLDAHVIDAEVGASLEALLSYLATTPRSLWRDDEAVFEEPGWEDVRHRAADALSRLDACLRRYDSASGSTS